MLDTLAKLFQARSRLVSWQQLSDDLLKLEHHADFKNLAGKLRKLATAKITLYVLTQKSDLSLNNEDVFPQACIDSKPRSAWKEVYISVVWLSYSFRHIGSEL